VQKRVQGALQGVAQYAGTLYPALTGVLRVQALDQRQAGLHLAHHCTQIDLGGWAPQLDAAMPPPHRADVAPAAQLVHDLD
jgi:hypothetical protein